MSLLALMLVGVTGCGAPAASAPVEEPARVPAPAPVAPVEPAAARADCSVPTVPEGCRAIAASGTDASHDGEDAAAAVDGDACTSWNAGRVAPAYIDVSLSEEVDLAGVVLVPAMTPGGAVTHQIQIPDTRSSAGERMLRVGVVERDMQDGAPFTARLETTALTAALRIYTTRSPSWVAWREIVPFACGTRHLQ